MSFEEAARACAYLDGLPDYMGMFMPEAVNHAVRDAKRASIRALKDAIPWDPKLRFQSFLAIQSPSYQAWADQYSLDPTLTPGDIKDPPHIDIPGTDFYYCHPILPIHERLSTASGVRRGCVIFDGPIHVPCLRRRNKYGKDTIWMSFTPMEVFTLRAGIKAAKGRVVLGGLGLGYQLIEISKKKSVKHITVVEQNFELFDWVWPRIRDRVNGNVTFLFGDAHKIIPKLTADRAIIDIDSSYGGNYFPHCPNIESVWVWGSVN